MAQFDILMLLRGNRNFIANCYNIDLTNYKECEKAQIQQRQELEILDEVIKAFERINE